MEPGRDFSEDTNQKVELRKRKGDKKTTDKYQESAEANATETKDISDAENISATDGNTA